MLRLNLWSYPRAFCCTGPMGATGTRLSLRPLSSRRVESETNLGRNAPRERGLTSSLQFEINCRMGRAQRNPSFVPLAAEADGLRCALPILRELCDIRTPGGAVGQSEACPP